MKVGIIGGGVVGLCSAYYLDKAGHDVTVIDKGAISNGCSFGNAGMIVPSHFIPLAAPGMIAKGVRWMFNSASPFYFRPRWDWDLARWGYSFYKHSTSHHVQRSMPALRDYNLFSKECYRELAETLPFDFGFQEKGLLMLYQDAKTEKEEIETAAQANKLGIRAEVLTLEEIQRLEPNLEVRARGGIYFPGDAHLTPRAFMTNLKNYMISRVKFLSGTTIVDVTRDKGELQVVSEEGSVTAFDRIVLAAGSWSAELAKKLELSLLMQGGKGYSFTLDGIDRNVGIPTIFVDARVAVTPMGNSLRFGGTMEIAGLNTSVNMKRVKGIIDSIPRYYPSLKVPALKKEDVWAGLRPCSPDGLPYVGAMKTSPEVIIATGHAMMGLSLGAGTGKIVAALVDGQQIPVDLSLFRPERFK